MSGKSLHIALVTSGLPGMVNSSLALAGQLRALGHQVTYMSPEDVGERVKQKDLTFVQTCEINFQLKGLKPLKGFRKLPFFGSIGFQKRIRKHLPLLNLETHAAQLGDLRVDLALIDVELHEVILASVKQSIPTVPISQWFAPGMNEGLPPLTSYGNPNEGKNQVSSLWKKENSRLARKRLKRYLTGRISRLHLLKQAMKEMGWSGEDWSYSYFPPLIHYNRLTIGILNYKEIEFPEAKPTNLHYLGAWIDENRESRQHSNQEEAPRLQELLSRKERDNLRLIYCTGTTMVDRHETFLSRLMQAVAKEPSWLLIISNGGRVPANLGALPGNVELFSWLPQMEVLRKVDVCVNHGGIHSINECIHFEVPMVGYSTEKFDQNGCVARLVARGLGLQGDRKHDDVDQIYKNIHSVLNDATYREALKKLKREVGDAHYKNALADFLVSIVGSSSQNHT